MTETLLSLLILLAVVAVSRIYVTYRLRWLRAAAFKLDRQIKAGSYTYRFVKHDEALQQRTEQRRAIADRMRTQARHVESGESVGKLLEMRKRS